jgi:hypothetical protein
MVERSGASEGIRTLDILVGNEMLYQTELRSRSEERGECRDGKPDLQAGFWGYFGATRSCFRRAMT